MPNFAVNAPLPDVQLEAPGPFQNLLTALGRPGYAFRNLITGDLEGALRQGAALGNQVSGALLTGGASLVAPELSPLGVLGRVAGFKVEDVAPRQTELEFSDVLRRWGAPAPEEGSWREFGVDLVGGVFTDPLTLLSGGTSSVAKGAVAGATRSAAQSTLLRGFTATAAGKAALRQEVEPILARLFQQGRVAGPGQAGRGVLGRLGALPPEASASVATEGAEALARYGVNLGEHGRFAGALVHAARKTAAERLLEGQLRGTFHGPLPRRLLGAPNSAGLAEQATEIAAGKGLLHRAAVRVPGRAQVAVPGALADVAAPFNRRIFGALGGAAAGGEVGAVAGALLSRTKVVDDALKGVGDAVKTRIYDKFLGDVPEGLQRTARGLADQARTRLGSFTREWSRLAEGLGPEQLNAATDALEEVHAEILEARRVANAGGPVPTRPPVPAGSAPPTPTPRESPSPTLQRLMAGIDPARRSGILAQAADLRRRVGRRGTGGQPSPAAAAELGPAPTASDTATEALMPGEDVWRQRLSEIAEAKPELAGLNPAQREAIFDLHLRATREQLDELVNTGGRNGGFKQRPREVRVGDTVRVPRPSSLPGSVQPGAASVDAKVVDLGGPRPVVLIPDPDRPVFMQTHEVDEVERIVRSRDGSSPYRPEELFYVPRRFQPWIEDELGDEAKRRFRSYAEKRQIKTRDELKAEVERKLAEAGKGGVIERDLYRQHGPLVRSLADLSISRYARHTEDMSRVRLERAAEGVEAWQPYVQRVTEAIQPGMPAGLRKAVGKVNHAWKGMLTVANPAFHARNFLSTLAQALQDPQIPTHQALATWLRTGGEAPLAFGSWVMRRLGFDVPEPRLGELAKLARGSYLADSDPGFRALRGIKVGRFTGDQVARMARGSIVRQGQVEREVIGDLMSDDLVDALRTGKHRGKLGRFAQQGDDLARDVSAFFEDRARLGAFVSLLRSGVEPDEAVRRVGRAFVEYDFQSTADYYARQLVPFVRFTVASTPVAIEATIKRPLLRNAGRAAIADEQEAPQAARRGFALPLQGGDYLAGLGLPVEAADQAMRSLLPTPGVPHAPELRRGLAQLHPLLTGPLQYATGRSLYSGSPFPLGRTIQPGRLADAAEQLGAGKRDPKTGAVRVDPRLNAALESSPFARQGADVLRAANFEGSPFEWLIQQTTGLRKVSAGDNRDMRRLISAYLQDRANRGDVNVFRRFYARDADPELAAALKALQALND